MKIKSLQFIVIFCLLSSCILSAIATVPDCGDCETWNPTTETCDWDCTTGQCCDDDVCVNDCGDCYTCVDDLCEWDCTTGQCCDNDTCVSSCPTGKCCDDGDCVSSCPTGECCDDGTCESSCPTGQCCDDGTCVSSCPTGKCCDDGTCESSCPTGKCCDDGTCVSSCPGVKCCKNGECETPDDWSTWTTSVNVTMPDNVTEKIEAAVEKIPNVGNIDIDEAEVSCSAKKKDCCNDDGDLIVDGERYKKCSFTLSADIDGINIWGPPTFDETFEITGVLKADLEIEAGVTLDADFSISATGGERWNECDDDENCYFGSIDADAGVSLSLTLEIDVCVKILWWEQCGSIEFTPASVSVGITCGVSFNSETACDGFNGDCCLKDIIFKSEFKIGGDIGLSFEKPIYETNDC